MPGPPPNASRASEPRSVVPIVEPEAHRATGDHRGHEREQEHRGGGDRRRRDHEPASARRTEDDLHDDENAHGQRHAGHERDAHRERHRDAGDEAPPPVGQFASPERGLESLEEDGQDAERHQQRDAAVREAPQHHRGQSVGDGAQDGRARTAREPRERPIQHDGREDRPAREQHLLCERRAPEREPREPAHRAERGTRRQRPPSPVVR